jgi:hypothetical protein
MAVMPVTDDENAPHGMLQKRVQGVVLSNGCQAPLTLT